MLLRVAHTPLYDQLQLEVETWIWKLPFFFAMSFQLQLQRSLFRIDRTDRSDDEIVDSLQGLGFENTMKAGEITRRRQAQRQQKTWQLRIR